MSAVEKHAKAIGHLCQDVSQDAGIAELAYEKAKQVLSDPAVIAEMYAETLTNAERAWLSLQIVDDDRYTKELRAKGRSVISFFTKDSNLRRLLTQEGGGQVDSAEESVAETSREPAAPDLRELYWDLLSLVQNVTPGETRHESARRIIHQHENQPCHGPAQADLLPKEESDGV